MFRATKPLIGTPLDHRTAFNELEFTPIGHESRWEGRTGARKSTVSQKPGLSSILQHKDLNPIDNSPLKNRLNGGSSFMDESENDTVHQSATKTTHLLDRRNSSSPITNGFMRYDLLNDGSNPVRQQQDSIKKLQDENYNLKVKLASLTRFVNSITNDEQHEIYKQNSELQEKLIAMRGELSTLNRKLDVLKGRRPSEHESVAIDEVKFKDEIRDLNKIIKELRQDSENKEEDYETIIRRLEEKNDELEDKIEKLENRPNPVLSSSHSVQKSFVDNLEDKVEDLKGELEDKDAELRSKDNQMDELYEKIENLETANRELHQRSSQRSEKDIVAQSQLEKYKYLVQQRDDEIEKLNKIIESKSSKLSDIKEDLIEAQNVLENEAIDKKDLESQLKSYQKKVAMLEGEISNFKQYGSDSKLEQRKLEEERIDLESEVEKLRAKVENSKSIIVDQKKLIQELQNQVRYSQEIEDLKRDNLTQMDKLEREIHRLSSERDSLKSQLFQSDQEIITLRNNSAKISKSYEELKNSFRKTEKDQMQTKSQQKDLDQLINKIEELNFENEKLFKSLEMEKSVKKSASSSYDKLELKSLSSKCNELQMELNERETEFNQKSSKLNQELDQCRASLQKKEEELVKLKSKLRFAELDYTEKFDDEKIQLIKEKRSKENQIKVLQFDLESLKEQYESEIKLLKSTIERLKNNSSSTQFDVNLPQSSTKPQSFDYEILTKINEKNSKIKYLNTKLEEAVTKLKSFEKVITNLEEEKQFFSIDNRKLESQLRIYEEKLDQYKAGLAKLSEMDSSHTEVESLKIELKIKERELEQVNKEFNSMKRDLVEKYQSVTDDKRSLQIKIDKMLSKYRQLEKSFSANSTNSKKISLLQDQNDLYRMKYTKTLYNIQDLKFVNSFMVKSIRATNKHVTKDIKKLQDVGIYPDYELICNKRLSLKVLIKFVVAAIRIKRKTEHSSTRNKRIETLGTKLELLDY